MAEVISESNRGHETVVKLRDYERRGVRPYWLVDPRASPVRVFVRRGASCHLPGVFRRGGTARWQVLEELSLGAGEVF